MGLVLATRVGPMITCRAGNLDLTNLRADLADMPGRFRIPALCLYIRGLLRIVLSHAGNDRLRCLASHGRSTLLLTVAWLLLAGSLFGHANLLWHLRTLVANAFS